MLQESDKSLFLLTKNGMELKRLGRRPFSHLGMDCSSTCHSEGFQSTTGRLSLRSLKKKALKLVQVKTRQGRERRAGRCSVVGSGAPSYQGLSK